MGWFTRKDAKFMKWPKSREMPQLVLKNRKIEETTMKRLLTFNPRPKFRLVEIERLIRKHRIIVPTPGRKALSCMCESGDFEAIKFPTNGRGSRWLVYEDSFLDWVKRMDGQK